MHKLWYVAINEYKRHVLRKGFILAVLSVPLILFVSIGAGYMVDVFENNPDPLGYVDLSGVLANPQPVPEGAGTRHPVELIAYPDEDAALAALDAGEIVDDALARATYTATVWLKRNFNVVQWVVVVLVAGGIGWQIYTWRTAKTTANRPQLTPKIRQKIWV